MARGVTDEARTASDKPQELGSGPRWHDPRIVALAFTGLAILVTALTREVADDPWILYRYAENLAGGDGWTFNPGSTSENAVTSPLLVLLLAAAKVVLASPVGATSAALFALGTSATATSAYATLRHLGHPVAGMAVGVLTIAAPPLVVLRGMETAVYLALLSVSLFCLATGRRGALGLSLGLAVLARPDAAVFAAAVVAWILLSERRIPWRTITAAGAVLIPWAIVAPPLTGGILPSTLAAKQAQAASGEWAGYVFGLAHLPLENGMTLWFLLAGVLALLGLAPAFRDCRSVLVPLAGAAVALVVAYGLVLRVASYPWYSALPVFLLIWLAGLGAERAVELVRRGPARVAVATVLVAVAAVAALQTPGMVPFRQQYEQVGAWLDRNAEPDATVAAAEIGRVGYFADREAIDYLGLLDSQANQHVRDRDWGWWVDVYRPDYWVTFRDGVVGGWAVDQSVRDDPRVRAQYEVVMETDDVVVLQRRA